VDDAVPEHAEPAPPAPRAGVFSRDEPRYREPPGKAGEAERDAEQEYRADRVAMTELPRAELDGIARAGRAMCRPDRCDRRRGANEEIHDAARDIAEPAHQCHRLGT